MRLAFIGGGVMGEAIIRGILDKGLTPPQSIIASDISAERRTWLSEKYGVATTSDNGLAVSKAEVILLAIKPQTLEGVMRDLGGLFLPTQLVLSIVAGANLTTLAQGLNHRVVVRVMPNTPAQIGEGISVWTTTAEVNKEQKEIARSILTALGKEIFVAEEKFIDMATALSGSGPAYIFLILEAFIDAGVHLGLSREVAKELVLQTVLGSTRLAQLSGKHPAELRNQVTSPGGTTVEGLLELERGGLRALLAGAVIAAYEKATLLAKGGK